ncbi:kinase-like protein [Ramicandelaber brevisporus]|nr:kinase-like protein [Ramicandelaber brevisporus]
MYGAPLQLLGQGTGGCVHIHRVASIAPAMYVAVKTHSFGTNTPAATQWDHMLAEAHSALRLQHANIVRTFEFVHEPAAASGDAVGTFYSVMEYCSTDLFELVHSGELTRPTINSIFVQLVHAVHHLHTAHGTSHRDLKLDNLCYSRADGRVKIIDFGCARTIAAPLHAASTTGVCGSDPYLPPEVLDTPQLPYNPFHLDVWSVAIVFLAMVSGHFPWECARPSDPNFAVYLKHRGLLINHWLKPENGDGDVSRLIAAMLAVEPERRMSIHDVVAHPAFQQLSAATPIPPVYYN